MSSKTLSSSAAVRMRLAAFWAKQKPGEPISVRKLFIFGPEQTIYQIMSEFAKSGRVKRLALGVYMIPTQDGSWPSAMDVALAKAEGFGKNILKVNKDYQKSIRPNQKNADENTLVLATTGCSSSFRYRDKLIRAYKVSDRKYQLLKKKTGAALATVWRLYLKKKSEIKKILKNQNISRNELRTGFELLHLLPMWLKLILRVHFPEMAWQAATKSFTALQAPANS